MWYTVTLGLALAVELNFGAVKYWSFYGIVELWLKIMQTGCLPLVAL